MKSGVQPYTSALARQDLKLSCVAFAFGVTPAVWFLVMSWESVSKVIVLSSVILLLGRLMFPTQFQVWWRAFCTGFTFALGVCVIVEPQLEPWRAFGAYTCLLSMFHYLEFAVTALTNPSNLSTDSFLLNHSKQYWMAAVASWVEYFVEQALCPSIKTSVIAVTGIVICLGGEILRKMAMFHAGRSFSHIVQSTKKADHKLVTDGVFSLMRHPSYVGWFFWSVGTQVVLCNPLCFLAYTYVSWAFFQERIFVEEYTLLTFFGDDYAQYQKTVPVGIPLIKGYVIDE
jgi:protein-S-isoprenylcysteine O-methyltransferase